MKGCRLKGGETESWNTVNQKVRRQKGIWNRDTSWGLGLGLSFIVELKL